MSFLKTVWSLKGGNNVGKSYQRSNKRFKLFSEQKNERHQNILKRLIPKQTKGLNCRMTLCRVWCNSSVLTLNLWGRRWTDTCTVTRAQTWRMQKRHTKPLLLTLCLIIAFVNPVTLSRAHLMSVRVSRRRRHRRSIIDFCRAAVGAAASLSGPEILYSSVEQETNTNMFCFRNHARNLKYRDALLVKSRKWRRLWEELSSKRTTEIFFLLLQLSNKW